MVLRGSTRRRRRRAVCVLSPHPLVLQELKRLIGGADSRFRVVTASLPSTPCDSPRIPRASLYVVDAAMPLPVTEAHVTTIAGRFPKARLLVTAKGFDDASAFALLGLGVKGLVPYAKVREQLLESLTTVASGGFWAPRYLLSRFVDSMLGDTRGQRRLFSSTEMSRREREVLEAVLDNLSNKEIAVRLHISERTVKFHVSNLLSKFEVQSRQEIISRCLTLSPPGA